MFAPSLGPSFLAWKILSLLYHLLFLLVKLSLFVSKCKVGNLSGRKNRKFGLDRFLEHVAFSMGL